MNTNTRSILLGSLLALGLASHPAVPRAQQVVTNDDWCSDDSWGDDREGVCEVREFVVPAAGAMLTVDATPNGGINVEGSARRDIVVRARVVATARTKDEARSIAARVQVVATADHVSADGPKGLGDRAGWHVSYRLAVPSSTPLSLKSTNGGISISDVNSRVEFDTVNGGVKLARMGGDVQGHTSNGGVDVDLDGPTWNGAGLDVRTANGGVKLTIPEGYSAHLETGTVNGRLQIDFPIMVQGTIGKTFSTDLGSGGPAVRVRTSNGGVHILKK